MPTASLASRPHATDAVRTSPHPTLAHRILRWLRWLEIRFQVELKQLQEEQRMRYVTSIERLSRQEGR